MKKTKVSVHVALLILILIASFLIRIIGTNPGFWEFHPDEPTTYVEAADMYMNSDINPRRFDYAAGIPLVHLVAFKTIFIPIRYAKLIITEPQTLVLALKNFDNFPQNLTFVIFGYRYLDALFWSRYVVAFLGAVSVYVLYVLTKKLFDWKTALIAAFLFAFNYRHVLSSHFALADIQNILTYLIATLGAVNLYYSNSRKNYILAGIYVGLSFSMKYQILSILPFGMVHLIWAWRERSFKYILNKNVILAGLALVATFLVLNPYLPSHIKPVPINIRVQSFITSNQVTARRYSFGSNVFNPFSYFYLYKWGVGRAISISILLGGVVMALRDKQRFLILASLIIPYFYLFTYYGGAGAGYYVRNFGVVIPFMLIFSAYLFTATYKFLKKRIKISKTLLNVSTVVLLLVISFSQIKASVALAYYYSMPWTHVELAKWAGDHIPHDAVMEEGSGVIQGELRKVGFNKIPRWLRDRESVMSMAEIREDEADFAVIVSNEIGHQFISWMNPLTASELLKYDGIPFERLNNTYFGLTVNEMLNYLVYEIYHKVSVPVNSRFIVKIPSMSSTKNGVVLKEMGFDEV
ncbi:MAG: glycosyltransferase family 39 protein, partial [bacterium]|nr:glycosyltransferase family 39 protein [bacterium]